MVGSFRRLLRNLRRAAEREPGKGPCSMKCPHCGIDAAARGAEVLKCWECGRWIEVEWVPATASTTGYHVGHAYRRPKKGLRGGWATTPTDVERLVEMLRSMGYEIPFRKWTFERLHVGHWQRSAGAWVWRIHWTGTATRLSGELGSSSNVGQCLRDGRDKADIER